MKIGIIHATAGAGHKKAAEALAQGFQQGGGHDVRLFDALDYTYPLFKAAYTGTYTFLVTQFPFVWGFFFALLDIPCLQPLVRLLRRGYNALNAHALEVFLKHEQFDYLITTHFLSAEVAAYLKRSGQIKARIICVVTDFDVHHIWVSRGIDAFTVACDFTKDKLIRLGVPQDQIFVTGIPTDFKFSQSVDKTALKQQLKLDPQRLTVLIASGSFGMGPIEQLIVSLDRYQLLIVCGHNKQLHQRLMPLAKGHVHVLGLVDNMAELMSVADVMVTKPGGLSISEALVKHLPMIFFSAIPGQETNNINVLKFYGVADDQANILSIAQGIDALQESPLRLEAWRAKLSVLAKPHAVQAIRGLIQ